MEPTTQTASTTQPAAASAVPTTPTLSAAPGHAAHAAHAHANHAVHPEHAPATHAHTADHHAPAHTHEARSPIITASHTAASPFAPVPPVATGLPHPTTPPIIETHPPHAAVHEHVQSGAEHAVHPHGALPSHSPVHHLPDAQLVILPGVLENAEKHLAAEIAKEITPALRDGLTLTLESAPSLKGGTTDVKLRFQGTLIAANGGLLGEEVIRSLKKNPAFAETFKGEHPPHMQPVEGVANAIDIHVPHLNAAQYATLIQTLASGTTPPHHQPHMHTADRADMGMQALQAMAASAHAPAEAAAPAVPTQADAAPLKQIVAPGITHGLVAANDQHALPAVG